MGSTTREEAKNLMHILTVLKLDTMSTSIFGQRKFIASLMDMRLLTHHWMTFDMFLTQGVWKFYVNADIFIFLLIAFYLWFTFPVSIISCVDWIGCVSVTNLMHVSCFPFPIPFFYFSVWLRFGRRGKCRWHEEVKKGGFAWKSSILFLIIEFS